MHGVVNNHLFFLALLTAAVLLQGRGVTADEAIVDDEPETIRLGGGAAATGWLGRMPKKRREKLLKPIKRSIPTVPAFAPPPEPILKLVPAQPTPSAASPQRTKTTLKMEGAAAKAPLKKISKAVVVSSPATSDEDAAALVPHPVSEEQSDCSPEAAAETNSGSGEESEDVMQSVRELFRPLRTATLSAALESQRGAVGDLRVPEDQAAEIFEQFGVMRDLPTVVADGTVWKCDYPIFYNPLYFEDPNMERCGVGHGCFTEVAAMVRFFGRIPIVPYMVGSNPPHTCVKSLGTCELCEQYGFHAYVPPLNVPGVAAQAVATVGLVFLLP